MNLQLALDVAVSTAKEAGEVIRHGLTQPKSISQKTSAIDLTTQFDQMAETVILQRLRRAFPEHHLVSEESGQRELPPGLENSPYTWYIDPIDGTNNFTHGYPFVCVSLALYQEGRPLLGVVYDPLHDECFYAQAGEGAFLTAAGVTANLRVSQAEELTSSLLATGFPYDRHHSEHDNLQQWGAFMKRAQGLRRSGSAALDLAYVAAGRLDGFWEFRLNSWDVAAGSILVREAGGTVSDIGGSALQLSPSVSLIASNGRIHQAMLGVLADIPRG